MKTATWLIYLAFFSGLSTSFGGAYDKPAPNTVTRQELADGWKLLFDGKSTDGWRNYRKTGVSPGWKIREGALTRVEEPAGDIITQGQYDRFELVLEYRISKGGNSGIMFHVTEEEETPWMTGPEIQVQDNLEGKDPQKAGWLYQFYKADSDATLPPGQWNHLRLIVSSQRSEVWLNGVKYYEFVKGSADWNARLAKSKFATMPKFGKATKGYICLQDHGDEVAYRSIKIRPLK